MTTAVHLDDASVNAVAERLAVLLRGESIDGELIDAAEVALRFGVSRDFVYQHADDLGAVRLGSGPRARLRFDPATVREQFNPSPRRSEETPQQKSRSTVRRAPVHLLPVRGQSP